MANYYLRLKKPKNPYFLLTIIADVNDADYRTETTMVEAYNKEEVEALFHALDLWGENEFTELENILSEDDYDFVIDVINYPRNDWGSFAHSLYDFQFEYYDLDGKVYDVIW
jgi:hypothetical protein